MSEILLLGKMDGDVICPLEKDMQDHISEPMPGDIVQIHGVVWACRTGSMVDITRQWARLMGWPRSEPAPYNEQEELYLDMRHAQGSLI